VACVSAAMSLAPQVLSMSLTIYLTFIYLTLSLYIPLPAACSKKPSCREKGGGGGV
jgi:hypothetical protein